MISRIVMVLALVLVSAAPASSTSCDEDSLETVSDDGGTLFMQSGRVYKVDDADTDETQLWVSGDDVLICDGEMINKDERGEKASVTAVVLVAYLEAELVGLDDAFELPL